MDEWIWPDSLGFFLIEAQSQHAPSQPCEIGSHRKISNSEPGDFLW